MRLRNHQVGQERLIDLVPVVSVVLLLMFFFLLSWSFVLQPGVEVRLPTANFPSATPQGRHVVTLKVSGKDVLYFFDERNVDLQGLFAEISNASKKEPGAWITMNADDLVAHGRVQEVAAKIMASDLKVTIATQRTSPSEIPVKAP